VISFLETDPALVPPMGKGGCAVLSSLRILRREYNQAEVNMIYASLVAAKFLAFDCTVLNWAEMLLALSPNLVFKAVEPVTYVCAVNEREILKWYLHNVNEDHFTVGNGASKTDWDPMNRPDVMAMVLPDGTPNAEFIHKVVLTYNL
jgi:hypothetical protein